MSPEPAARPSASPVPTLPAMLSGRSLLLARVVWVTVALLSVGLFAAGVPVEFAHLQKSCLAAACDDGRMTAEQAQMLVAQGLPISFYAAATVAAQVIALLTWSAVSLAIFLRMRNLRMVWFVSLFLVTSGATVSPVIVDSLARVYPALTLLVQSLKAIAIICLFLFFCLFPDGRFVPSWTRWFVLIYPILAFAGDVLPGSVIDIQTWPPLLDWLVLAPSFGMLVFAQVYRYRHSSNASQRQQTKWVVFGTSVALVGLICLVLVGDVLVPLLGQPASLIRLSLTASFSLLMLLIPLSIGVAVLHERLWDIDLIINRTLVFGALSVCVVGLYVLVVGGLGALFQARSSALVALLATSVVAVVFAPLRERLQRGVNRMVYGDRDDPYAVMARLDQRLATTLAPDAVLPTIVETVAQALRLPYVAVTIDEGRGRAIAASVGVPVNGTLQLPLVYQGQAIGQLILGPRARGEDFSAADRRLLESLARHAGGAAHALRLTADLQRAREHLVLAREEERRRIRRDLHDGLGPLLASQMLTVDAALKLLPHNTDAGLDLLRHLKAQSQEAIADIRRLVYALRPPALDDLGLVAALREQAAHYDTSGVQITIATPQRLPPLPAAVEVAVYRIVQEALTNVIRHAGAQTCMIQLIVGDDLTVTVVDDGCGMEPDQRAGIGLVSMRERAAELGGRLTIEQRPGGGTRVSAHLPLGDQA